LGGEKYQSKEVWMVKLRDILSEVLFEDFGDVAFGQQIKDMRDYQIDTILQLQRATKQEPNTEEEKELLNALWKWVYEVDHESILKIYSFESLIRKYMNKFPSILKPKTKNGTFLYRGIRDPSSDIIEMFENFESYDLEEINIENEIFFKIKKKITLTHHRPIQSWSSDFDIVHSNFLSDEFPILLRTKQNKEFLFNQDFLHALYDSRNESEILHFGKEYSNEIEVLIGVNFIKSIGREDILEEIAPYEAFRLNRYLITKNPDGSIDYDGNVDLDYKELEKLPFNFRNVSGYFDCTRNKLKTLRGAPKEVGRSFNCSHNNLKSLNGAPEKVGGDFVCFNNNPPLPQSEKDWAEENIKARTFSW